MKRWGFALLAGALVLPGGARAVSVGAGIFAGPSIPVIQDDTGTGVQFGLRLPIHVIPALTIEPFYARSNLGDVTETFNGTEYTRSGFDDDSFGVTLAMGGLGLSPGAPFYPYGSIASHNMTRAGSEDISEVGYELGLGFSFRLSPLAFNVRAGGGLVATGDTSRKFFNVNLGVATKLYGKP